MRSAAFLTRCTARLVPWLQVTEAIDLIPALAAQLPPPPPKRSSSFLSGLFGTRSRKSSSAGS